MRPGLKVTAIAVIIFSSVVMTSAPVPKKAVKHTIKEKSVGDISLVFIPAGSFKMGRDVKGRDYAPSRGVKITKGFWIGKYEITQKQYRDLKGTNPCTESRYGEGDSLPLFNVSWYDAVEFCNELSLKHGLKPYYNISKNGTDDDNISAHDDVKREVTVNKDSDGFRLPTEAQWEYACMGTKLSDFYWGNNQSWDGAGAYAWHMFNAGRKNYSRGRFWWVKYHKVQKPGQKRPNLFGVYDMSGNVAEWCFDRYTPSYPSSEKEDPDGGDNEFRYRVVRGGSILDSPKDLAGYKRWPVEPFEKTGTNGIRVVLPE
jgi:formylglycine-generating enzyme required for sulfatase activity